MGGAAATLKLKWFDCNSFICEYLIERNLLCVLDDFDVVLAKLALELLRDRRVLAEGRRNQLDQRGGTQIPPPDQNRASPSDQLRELFRKEDDIKKRLCEIGVDHRERVGPLLDVGRDLGLRVLDPAVQVRDLIENEILHVLLREVLRKGFSEEKGQAPVQVFDVAVHEGRGHRERSQLEDLWESGSGKCR